MHFSVYITEVTVSESKSGPLKLSYMTTFSAAFVVLIVLNLTLSKQIRLYATNVCLNKYGFYCK